MVETVGWKEGAGHRKETQRAPQSPACLCAQRHGGSVAVGQPAGRLPAGHDGNWRTVPEDAGASVKGLHFGATFRRGHRCAGARESGGV